MSNFGTISLIIICVVIIYCLQQIFEPQDVDADTDANSDINKVGTYFSSDMMIQFAFTLTEHFIEEAPILVESTYNKDEIHLFCCWILFDYGVNYGYINKDTNLDDFFNTIFYLTSRTDNKSWFDLSDVTGFTNRMKKYQSEIKGMQNSKYSKTKTFFPHTLYALFVIHINWTNYHFLLFSENNLIKFTEYLRGFLAKVNIVLMAEFPRRM